MTEVWRARQRALRAGFATAIPPRWRPACVALLVLGVALACWWYSHTVLPWEPWGGDSREYAVIARRIAAGEGFTTPVIFPVELSSFGATEDHPSLMRAPLWPLVLAGFFRVFGSEGWVVHLASMVCFAAVALTSTALATRIAGIGAGLLAGIAVATSPQFLVFSIDGMSEALFALWVGLALLLCARGSRPFLIGIVCGLGYLTRYNGGVLVVMACGWLFLGPGRFRAATLCALGFLAAASPWWIRNAIVTGDPFYSLYNLHAYMSPLVKRPNTHLHYWLEPDLTSRAAMHPIEKLRVVAPEILRHFPYAGANLAACLGVVLGCLRGNRSTLAFAFLALTNLAVVSLALPNGRYLVPLFPAMIAVGTAAWALHGGRWRAPALALVLMAPLLPMIPRPLPDVARLLSTVAGVRQGGGYGAPPAPGLLEARVRCLAGRPVVLAEDASRVAWQTDAIAIHLPIDGHDFWTIVREQPVRFVQLKRWKRVRKDEFDRQFEARPDCGPDLYERRSEPARAPMPS